MPVTRVTHGLRPPGFIIPRHKKKKNKNKNEKNNKNKKKKTRTRRFRIHSEDFASDFIPFVAL